MAQGNRTRGPERKTWSVTAWHDCAVCGVRFKHYNKKARYCSRKCYERSMLGKPNPNAIAAMNEAVRGKPVTHNRRPEKIERQRMKVTGRKRPEHSRAMSGNCNPAWNEDAHRGGYGAGWLSKNIRKALVARDGDQCFECGVASGRLARHHIDYNKQNNALENFVLLCNVCHSRTNYNRAAWIKHFRKAMSNDSRKNNLDQKQNKQGHFDFE